MSLGIAGQEPEELDDEEFRGKTRDRAKRRDKTRTRVKQGKALPQNALRGDVLQPVGPAWIVQVEGGDGTLIVATVSGTVDSPEADTIVTVGDVVWVVESESGEQRAESGEGDVRTGMIVKVEDRSSVLSRKMAGRQKKQQVVVANVDQLAIVMAAREPKYNKRLIDRYLIAADKGELSPLIIINKVDLVAEDDLDELEEDFYAYEHDLKIPVFFTSTGADDGQADEQGAGPFGLEELEKALIGKRTLLHGPSGVGKSSLINLLSEADQQVGAISTYFMKGKHTTTAARIVALRAGGSLVDSPGIREFAIWELDLEELPFYFEEFVPFMHECKFTPCTHTHEPGCAVKDALEEGKIDPERYLSYLMLRDQLENEQAPR